MKNTEILLELVRQFPSRKHLSFDNDDDRLFLKQILLALKASKPELEEAVVAAKIIHPPPFTIDLEDEPLQDNRHDPLLTPSIPFAVIASMPPAAAEPCQHLTTLGGKCVACGAAAGNTPEQLQAARRRVASRKPARTAAPTPAPEDVTKAT